MTGFGLGHPDWQAYANWRGQLSQNTNRVFPPGFTTIGLFTTTNYASVYLELSMVFGIGQLQLFWYYDAQGTNQIETVTYNLASVTRINVLLPASGNLLGVVINNTQVGNLEATVNVLPTNLNVPKPTFHIDPGIIGEKNTNVNAGATNTTTVAPYIGGLAHVMFDPTGGVSKLRMVAFTLDLNGAQELEFLRFELPAAPVEQLIVVPARPVQVQIVNTDGAANHTYSWALVPTGG